MSPTFVSKQSGGTQAADVERGPEPIAEFAAATSLRRWPAVVLSGTFAWIE